jgi:hypothetical protein
MFRAFLMTAEINSFGNSAEVCSVPFGTPEMK